MVQLDQEVSQDLLVNQDHLQHEVRGVKQVHPDLLDLLDHQVNLEVLVQVVSQVREENLEPQVLQDHVENQAWQDHQDNLDLKDKEVNLVKEESQVLLVKEVQLVHLEELDHVEKMVIIHWISL